MEKGNSGFSVTDLEKKGYIETSPGQWEKMPLVIIPEICGEIKRGPLFIEKKDLIFRWADKHISLNEWYSGDHWSQRNKAAKEWHQFFKDKLTKPYQYFEKYTITLQYNSNLDPSNCITMIKLVEDMLQKEGIIKNDNKANCKGLTIFPNETMKKKSYRITIKHVS